MLNNFSIHRMITILIRLMFIILLDHAQIYWEYLGWHSFHTLTRNITLTFFGEKKTTGQYRKICIERLFFFLKCCHTNNKDPLPWSDEDWNAAPPQVGPQSTDATMVGISQSCQRFMKLFFQSEGILNSTSSNSLQIHKLLDMILKWV